MKKIIVFSIIFASFLIGCGADGHVYTVDLKALGTSGEMEVVSSVNTGNGFKVLDNVIYNGADDGGTYIYKYTSTDAEGDILKLEITNLMGDGSEIIGEIWLEREKKVDVNSTVNYDTITLQYTIP